MHLRMSKDVNYLLLARVISLRGTCARRKVGTIIVDKFGYILSAGYNGPPSNVPNCIEFPCEGACLSTGFGLDKCIAIHAEANALVRLKEPFQACTIYTTISPCIHCVKLLMGTAICRIVFNELYIDQCGRTLWESIGRSWEHIIVTSADIKEFMHEIEV